MSNTVKLGGILDIGMMVSVHQWPGRPVFKSSHTKDSKMVLDAALLYTQHYKVGTKDKVEQFRERSSALPYALVY